MSEKAPIPPLQSSPAGQNGAFDPHFYQFLLSLQRQITKLQTENTALKAALNEVRQNPTTTYPAI